jgi:hypothetical protein
VPFIYKKILLRAKCQLAYCYQRNSFSRGFSLLFNVETLQAFGALLSKIFAL